MIEQADETNEFTHKSFSQILSTTAFTITTRDANSVWQEWYKQQYKHQCK